MVMGPSGQRWLLQNSDSNRDPLLSRIGCGHLCRHVVAKASGASPVALSRGSDMLVLGAPVRWFLWQSVAVSPSGGQTREVKGCRPSASRVRRFSVHSPWVQSDNRSSFFLSEVIRLRLPVTFPGCSLMGVVPSTLLMEIPGILLVRILLFLKDRNLW